MTQSCDQPDCQEGDAGAELEIILAAHGEAESAGFFENFRVGQRTLAHSAQVMSLPAPLRWLICTFGALRKRIGNRPGSPHNAWTRAQATALAGSLESVLKAPVEVKPAFASCRPLLEALIAQSFTSKRRIFLSMSPSDSRLSCGLICHALQESGQHAGQVEVLARLWDDPEFLKVNAAHVRAECAAAANSLVAKSALLLVFHGTLVSDRGGRPPSFHTGLAEKLHFAKALQTALLADADAPWTEAVPAYLNHDVAGSWTQPTVEAVLADLDRRGFERVWAFACDYLVDSSEVVGSLADKLAVGPIADARLVPCLNANPELIEFMARRVRAALGSRSGLALCDACPRACRDQSPAIGTSGAKSKLS